MSLTTHTKPISYLKANAAKIAAELKDDGEAVMVVQSVTEHEQTQETLAMLKTIAQSDRDIKQGKVHDAKTVFAQLRSRLHSKRDL
ncbi:MAG: prevent-host-death protein [Gammaproteobacteria bacterium]|nr:MAG: prevent-host-death protein [Gammaproteobacteria bacterium]